MIGITCQIKHNTERDQTPFYSTMTVGSPDWHDHHLHYSALHVEMTLCDPVVLCEIFCINFCECKLIADHITTAYVSICTKQ